MAVRVRLHLQVSEDKSTLAASLLSQNPNVIFARSAKDWYNAWHIAAQAGSLPVRPGGAGMAAGGWSGTHTHTHRLGRVPPLPRA